MGIICVVRTHTHTFMHLHTRTCMHIHIGVAHNMTDTNYNDDICWLLVASHSILLVDSVKFGSICIHVSNALLSCGDCIFLILMEWDCIAIRPCSAGAGMLLLINSVLHQGYWHVTVTTTM